MQWLVIQDDDGSWDSISLECVEAIQYDGRGAMYVFRKGLPPKGARPRQVALAAEPFLGVGQAGRSNGGAAAGR